MVRHSELPVLAAMPGSFGLLADCLRGAMTEVGFEVAGEWRVRTHMTVGVEDFPSVLIGVEGSATRPNPRFFFRAVQHLRPAGMDVG